ncbi:MAG TPA: hypothetical protein VEH27_11530 [Methylomirabilota bacterium]|nr:hypothetical protein [Methylomirabilota bacterium]
MSSTEPPRKAHGPALICARNLIAYFVVCMATLPLVRHVWIGELPLLALVQLPKLQLAQWFRKSVVMPLLKPLGLSVGSFSPDYSFAGPYGLALAYLLVVGVVLLWLRQWSAWEKRERRTARILAAVALLDFLATLLFSSQRTLTLY